jgi:trehalose-phosphatase
MGRSIALEIASLETFRLMDGHRFLEVGPWLAHKGRTVKYVLVHYPWPDSLPLYLGDDDKDEEAFGVIRTQGGIAVLVAQRPRDTDTNCRLESPRVARAWLKTLSASPE